MKKRIQPPRLAGKIFLWYCKNASVEDLHGDMEELFYKNLGTMSARKARLKYIGQVISLLFSYALKRRKHHAAYHPLSSRSNSIAMIKSYFKVGVRTLARQRFFTIINVLGLAIGMSVCLLFVAMLSHISTYDNFHVNKNRIYRVNTQTDDRIRVDKFASAPPLLAEKLRHEFTGIDKVIRINSTLSEDAVLEGQGIPLRGYFVDPDFFEVFSFPAIKGQLNTALQKPNSMAITEKTAHKMFGDEDPMNKIITMGKLGDFEITALLKDVPKNSHLNFEVLISYATIEAANQSLPDWKEFRNNYIYLLLPEDQKTDQLSDFLTRTATALNSGEENFTADFELQKFNDIAPGPDVSNDPGPEWDYTSLTIFGVLTLLILLPACFNYANISISRALKRSKEIGLRKVVGGQRRQIFFQFMVETILITLIALAGAYLIFLLIRPEFLSMIVGSEALDLETNIWMISYFIAFALFVGIVAGSIPALYFSKLNPVQALKNAGKLNNVKGFSFKKVMIVVQFALSLGFIMGVVVVLQQYRATMNYNFGFDQENILDVDLQGVDQQLFRNEYDQLSAIRSVSMSSHVLGAFAPSACWIKEKESDSVMIYQMFIDHNYLNNLDLKLISGENFSDHPVANRNSIIVNEEYLKQFKLTPETVLGKTISISGQGDVTVSGVVRDFHYLRLNQPIQPFFFRYDTAEFRYANLKIASSDIHTTFSDLEISWDKLGSELRFSAEFFDDEIEESYSHYFSMVKICGFLGILAISISCLGLLGMVVYTVETRIKEIGVRKVMGASVFGLTLLLSKSYIKLMLIAAMIAIPIAYILFDKALLGLQYYKIPIGIPEIVISLLIILILGISTIFSQTFKAARANPVDTLRYE